jgi:hypothetical protein
MPRRRRQPTLEKKKYQKALCVGQQNSRHISNTSQTNQPINPSNLTSDEASLGSF